MIRPPRIPPIHAAVTWLLVVLMLEPQNQILGQHSSPYVRALEVLLAPSAASSSAPILVAQAQPPSSPPLPEERVLGQGDIQPTPLFAAASPANAPTIDTNLFLGLARTPITLTNGNELLSLSFFSDSNHNYVVEFRDELGLDLCNNWQPLTNAPHNYGIVFTEANVTNRFYRLRRIDVPRSPLFALLANDTGTNSLDGVTYDPTIMGMALQFPAGTVLQGSLDVPGGPFVPITNLGAPRHFVISRDHLNIMRGAPVTDGPHTLYLRAENAGQTLATFDLTFFLDTTPPAVTVSLAAASDSPPIGDGRTASNPVTLNGQTEPGARLELLAATPPMPGGQGGWVVHTISPDNTGAFALTNVVLAEGTNSFYFRALDAACNETNTVTQICWYRPNCAFPDNLDGWIVNVGLASSLAPNPVLGSVRVATDKSCAAVMTEGDSLLVTLSKDLMIPTLASVLTISYEANFDTTTPNAMRDAFEVALVDSAGRPITYTIQGSNAVTSASVSTSPALPPSPDACFNHTDSRTPFTAPGAGHSQIVNGQFQVALDVSHLTPGSNARLILRLVNNDRDRSTAVRITGVGFKTIDATFSVNGSLGSALSSISAIPGGDATTNMSSPDCRPSALRFQARAGSRPLRTAPCASLPSGLVGWWSGDGHANDLVGTNHGILTNGASFAPGIVGDAFMLDGVNDYVLIPDAPELNPRQALTIAAWYRPSSFAGNGNNIIVGKVSEFLDFPYYQYSLAVAGDQYPTNFSHGDFVVNIAVNGNYTGGSTPSEFWQPNTWYHLAGTFDGETIRFYVNCSLIESRRVPGTVATYGQPLVIGTDPRIVGLPGPHFTPGAVDEVMLFNRALSSNEIAELCVTPPCKPETVLPPSVDITAPADDSKIGTGVALLTGLALADRPTIRGLAATNRIILVTVNSTPVDAMDAAGNFFSAIEVRPGQNVFEVVATDAFNLSTTNTVTAYGETCPQNFASLGEVSASVQPDYGRTSFNEWTKVLYADLALHNAGTYPIRAPFYVGVTRISDPSVRLLSPDGVSADGIPYYDYSGTLATDSLDTGSLTAARALAFHNPNKVQFTYDLVVLGQLNQAPYFTTTPVLEAIVGKPYSYAFHATDPDGDLLTYALLSSPTGMVLNASPSPGGEGRGEGGQFLWTPSTNQLGTHDIRLRADDGKGGMANQHYLLNVINPLSNRPPYFVSTPVVVARVSKSATATGATAAIIDFEAIPSTSPVEGLAISNQFRASHGVSFRRLNGTFPRLAQRGLPVTGFSYPSAPDGDKLDPSDPLATAIGDFFLTLDGSATGPGFSLIVDYDFPVAQASGYVLDIDTTEQWNIKAYSDDGLSQVAEVILVSGEQGTGNGRSTQWHFERPPADLRQIRFIYTGPSDGGVAFDLFSSSAVFSEPTYVYDTDARDPDLDPVTYSLVTAPTNMSINPLTGLIRWAPSASEPSGTFSVAETVFSDDSFADDDWMAVKYADTTAGQAASFSAFQRADGGNPGPYRYIQHRYGLGYIAVGHIKKSAIFEPSIQGRVTQIRFSLDAIHLDPPAAQAVGFFPILLQGDSVYGADTNGAVFGQTWTNLAATLVATNFVKAIGSGPLHPDFSENAQPLQFGFITSNSSVGADLVREAGFDNLRITVTSEIELPAGMVPVTVQASDGRGGVAYQSYRICVLPAEGNRPPIIVSQPVTSIVPGREYSYDVHALDPDADTLSFSLITAPGGMTINATDGLIQWEPSPAFFASNALTFSDETFNPGDWGRTNFFVNNIPTISVLQRTDSGDPGNFREMNFFLGDAGQFVGTPIYWEFYPHRSATYFPRTQGRILYVNYSEDRITLGDVGNTSQFGLLGGLGVRQNGRLYAHTSFTLVKSNWTSFGYSGLTENDFVEFAYDEFGNNSGTLHHPDFSTNGAPLEFGIFRHQSNAPRAPAHRIVEGIDNWRVEILPALAEAVHVEVKDGRGGADSQQFSVIPVRSGMINGFAYADTNADSNWQQSEELWVNGTKRFLLPSAVLASEDAPLSNGDLEVGPDGLLYALDSFARRIERYDPRTREQVDVFSEHPDLYWAFTFTFGPDGDIYLVDYLNKRILRCDGRTGAYRGVFAADSRMINPLFAKFGPNGNLFVTSGANFSESVFEFDGRSGSIAKAFIPGLGAAGLDFGADGKLYVGTHAGNGNVYRFDPDTGALLGEFVTGGSGGLAIAGAIVFTSTGRLIVASTGNKRLLEFDGTTGQYLRTIASGFSPNTLKLVNGANTEPPLAGWTVYLDQNRNGRRDALESLSITDTNGQYAFSNLNSGIYHVRQETPPGWRPTNPSNQLHVVDLDIGQSAWRVDFANVQKTDPIENGAPTFLSQPITRGEVSADYIYAVTALDPDGEDLNFDLVTYPEGMLVETNSGVVAWRPTLSQLGTHEVILRVQDGRGGVALQSWQITVIAPNSPPIITTFPPGPAVVGLPYVYVVRAQDAEGGALMFSLGSNAPVGLTLTSLTNAAGGSPSPGGEGRGEGGETAVLSWTPALTNLGSNPIEIIVRDESGAEARQAFALEVVPPGSQNRAPQFVSTPRTQTRVGLGYTYLAEARDPDGDLMTLLLLSGPAGMVLTNGSPSLPGEGVLVWTPTTLGAFPVTLAVNDGRAGGVVTQAFVLNVSSTLSNSPPLVISQPPLHATAGQPYVYDLAAEDADGDTLSWRLAQAPVGVSLDPNTGALRWTPTLEHLGTNVVTVEVQDGLLTTATQTWQIDVGCLNRPPQITSVPATGANVGEPYLYAARAEDPDGDGLAFSFIDTNGIPSGMTLSNLVSSANSGLGAALICWTPTTNQTGPHLIRLRVRDGRGGENEQTYTLYAVDQRANKPPGITSTPPRGATVGRSFSYTAIATDPDGDALTFEWLQVPAGAVPNLATVQWTPTSSQLGSHDFIVVARDPYGASASQRFTVLVRENQAPRITSDPRTNAVPGVPYRYDVFASDPDGDALTYSLAAPVPSGLAIDSLGRISWTPSLAQIGVFPVTVTVSDPFGGSTDQSFAITVAADTQPPEVSLTLVQGLANQDTGQWSARLGNIVQVRVNAFDNVGVASRALYLDGRPLALNGGNAGSFLADRPGVFNLTGVAFDAAGNSNSAVQSITFFDPTATNQMFVQIHAPANDSVITAPVDIVATITNDASIVSYSWGYALLSEVDPDGFSITDPQFTILGTSNLPPNTTRLDNIVVGRFDPTILNNDTYILAVGATDTAGIITNAGAVVHVQGNLKFGEFRLEFTDLAIPVAGIPITIQRVYDSRNAKRIGDFGHGWSLGVQDAIIRESVPAERSFRPNTRVYLYGPDGRRLGFTFAPTLVSASLLGAVFRPGFVGEPGVYDRLEVPNEEFSFEGAGFLGDAFEALGPYNPNTYFLTTRDGTRYTYEQSSGLQNVTDRNGNRLEYTRDGIFHYNAGSTASDQSVRFIRDTRGRIRQIIDPNGNALTYSYDGAGDLRSFADQTTNTTRYFYSANRAHFLTNIVDSLGRSALGLEYDSTGRLKTVRDANGNPISQDFDPTTKAATFTDGNGTVIHTRFDDNGNETYRRIDGVYTNFFAYDANNNLLGSTNGRGFSTNYTYDARGNVTAIRDSLGNRTSIAYNNENKPTGVTNALGQILNLSYNSSGQLTQVVNNAGFKTAVTRDAQGRVVSLTDATGTNTTIFDYSNGCACGRPGKVINPDGSFRLYEYNSQGLTNRVVNELGAETLFHHDDAGRLLWMRDPLTNYTQFFYNGPLLTNVVDALGRSTHYEYDALNRTNRIFDAEGGVVEFRYDNNGNRTNVIDAVTNVTTFVYDAANRLTRQIDPLGHTNFFTYDAAGNRTEAIDRNGRRRTFAYDAANRMTNELWWEGTNVVRSIVFGFNELGVQTLAADPAARYEYSYDSLNRLERVLSQSAGVPDFTLLYTYTALGQVSSVTDHWGARVGSGYDNRNRLASRTWSSTLPGAGVDPARVDFSYDASGNRLRADRFADLAGTNRIGFTTNAYNRAGIVTNITHLGPASKVLAKYDYNFDAAYQITRWAIGNQLSDFAYDRTGQLTNALNTAQPNENFRFDANGNRVGAQSGGSYVVGGNNQILSDGTNSYAYDFEGNMTSRSNTVTGVLTTYQWDHRNRLLSVLDFNPGGVVTQTVAFVYDAMNRRLSKTVNGPQNTNVVRFLYNQDDSWADLDGTNAVTARYLHGARIDELLARQRASDGRGWYLTDHLGTVRDIANAAGAIVAHVDYSSFGQVLGISNAAVVDRFLFTGRELDGETGLYSYRARYYRPSLAQFISQDPLGFDQVDYNLYRYVANSPLSAGDPTGQSPLFERTSLENKITIQGLRTKLAEQTAAQTAAQNAFRLKLVDVLLASIVCVTAAVGALEDGQTKFWEQAVVFATCAAVPRVAL